MAMPQRLPNFLEPLSTSPQALPFAEAAQPRAGGSPAPIVGQKIVPSVAMAGQEQTNWCWSAVTEAVKTWAGENVSQTDIATAHITHNGRTGTCNPPHGSDSNGAQCATGNGCAAGCNDPHILSVILTENALFKRYMSQDAAPAFADIVACINVDKPVPCRVQWGGGGGHFVLVIGWTIDNSGTQQVHVLDPASVAASEPVAERVLVFSQFVNAYTLSGLVGSINYSYEVQQ